MSYRKQASAPTNKVSFFNHFQHYFLRPYDTQIKYSQQEFLEKLSARNCEWLTRPNVAVSETAQALTNNWKLVENCALFDESIRGDLKSIIDPMMENLENLDNKNKTRVATDQDIFEVMQAAFQNPEIDDVIGDMMQASSAMYVMLSHLRVMRGLITNPHIYSKNLVHDAPTAVQFKRTSSIPDLQKMLTAMCVPATVAQPPPDRANLSALGRLLVNPSSQSTSAPSSASPSSSRNPSSSGLQPPRGSAEPTVHNAQPPQETVTNQLMDMILQLQNQMQQMQNHMHESPKQQKSGESYTRASNPSPAAYEESQLDEPVAEPEKFLEAVPAAPEGRKRRKSALSNERPTHFPEADQPEEEEQPKRKKKARKLTK